jgi:hypothetical protein
MHSRDTEDKAGRSIYIIREEKLERFRHYRCKNWTLSDRLLGQGVLQWVKSFVGIGSLWKLDWWSNDWLINWLIWLINLLTYWLTTECGQALIPNLIIRELRLFDIIAWRREKLLTNENLSALHSNEFLWIQRMIMRPIYQKNNKCACVRVTNENQIKNITGSI